LKPATGHYGVNGAVRNEVFVSFVVSSIANRQFFNNARELRPHVKVIDAVDCSEHFPYILRVFPPHPPDVWSFAVVPGLKRILNIENIPEARVLWVRPVNEGDALRASLYPPAHPFVPEVDARAGGGVRALGVNERLIHERIFVHPSCAAQERRPAFGVLCYLPKMF
jgi:hypothetical protein